MNWSEWLFDAGVRAPERCPVCGKIVKGIRRTETPLDNVTTYVGGTIRLYVLPCECEIKRATVTDSGVVKVVEFEPFEDADHAFDCDCRGPVMPRT